MQGKLIATAPGNPDTLSYKLAFGGSGFSLADGDVSFDSATVTPAEGDIKNLAISYPQTWLRSGGYEDTAQGGRRESASDRNPG